jgi:amidase
MTARAEAAIGRAHTSGSFDPALPPALEVGQGATVTFATVDARAGALAKMPVGSPFELPLPPRNQSNLVTGPLAIRDVRPGDGLAVDILDIQVHSPAWVGAHAHINPLGPGRIPRSLGRLCPVVDGLIEYAPGITLAVSPMVGCIGTAAADNPSTAGAGAHGGNLDHASVAVGTRVILPVFENLGLLYLGDVHAAQGDGELSGVAAEVSADVLVAVDRLNDLDLTWPWLETSDTVAVVTCGADLPAARRAAVEAMLERIEAQLSLEPADGLALISVAGNLRLGQAVGGMDLTARLEMPKLPGLSWSTH